MKIKVIKIKSAPSTTVVKTKEYNEQMKELADLRGQVDTLNAALESAYTYQEKLFQEAKDLRLAEARAMSDKKKAEEDFYTMKKNYFDVCADRDNLETAYKQLQRAFANCTRQTNEEYKELSDECYDLRDQLRDREARIDELEQRIEWLVHEEAFWHKAAEENAEEKEAFEAALQGFEKTRKEYEAEIVRVCQQKRELYQQLEEAQKRADMNHQLQADSTDKISTQTAVITIYKNTLARRDATITEQSKEIEALEAERIETAKIINELRESLNNCRKQLVEANKARQVPAKFNSVWDVLASHGLIKEDKSNG